MDGGHGQRPDRRRQHARRFLDDGDARGGAGRELIRMLSGTHTYDVLIILGMDRILVDLFVTVHIPLVARAIIWYTPTIPGS